VLVNNAAHYVPAPAQDTRLEDWQQHFDTNVTAPFVLCAAARPSLIASGSGVVVNVLSTLASRPVAGTAAYSASKAALLSLTQTLALEWAADGVRVVAVSPGVVDTPVHSRQHLEQLASAHPLGRVGNADEIAQAILFLASPASDWSTGTVLVVDGGISLA